jgi:hypothetical protein
MEHGAGDTAAEGRVVEEGRREGVSPHLVSDRLVRAKIAAARK